MKWMKPGLVISQKPGFGAVLPKRGKVRLVVSTATRPKR
jgi:beta-lactam-binding protein with PASTA domain